MSVRNGRARRKGDEWGGDEKEGEGEETEMRVSERRQESVFLYFYITTQIRSYEAIDEVVHRADDTECCCYGARYG